jgi:hypothetical protein
MRWAKVEHRETFVNLAIPIGRAQAIPSSPIKKSNYRLQNEMSTTRAVAFLRPSRYIWGNGTD